MFALLRFGLCCFFAVLVGSAVDNSDDRILAASNCHCNGIAFGHTYSGMFVGSQSGSKHQVATSNAQ
ncbi:MAG TPA: hypothetical protein VF198_06435 [Vicinamibacterales bacterium]